MSVPAVRRAYRAGRDRLLALAFDVASRWVGRHTIEGADRAGRRLGSVAHLLLAAERRRVLEGLAVAFPELSIEERRALAREVFRHLGANLAEVLRIVSGKGAELVAATRWRNRERLEEALRRGRGVVLITGHCGNWELLGAATVAAGFPLTVVARAMKDPALEARAEELRRRGGLATAIRESPGSAKALLFALRSGGCLGVLIDQDIDAEGVFVPFFGRPAWTPAGAALLALRRGAPLLTILSRRLAPGEHEIEVFEEIVPPVGATVDEAALEMTARATATIEAWIRSAPEQWVWMHRRWKRRPLDEAGAPPIAP